MGGGNFMNREQIEKKIDGVFSIVSSEVKSNCVQLKLDNGCIINCFNNGNHNYQGKNIEEVKAVVEGKGSCSPKKKIFVVYGHDDIAKIQLEAMLRRWDLEPVILDQQVSAGQTIIEKLEEYSKEVQYAIVLATPDDEGKAVKEGSTKKRVRQNVVLELGMFLAKLGREKVAILLKEDVDFEKPSDIQGLVYISFRTTVEEVTVNLVKELSNQGYNIDNKKL